LQLFNVYLTIATSVQGANNVGIYSSTGANISLALGGDWRSGGSRSGRRAIRSAQEGAGLNEAYGS